MTTAWSALNICGTQFNRLGSDGTILERVDGDDNVVLTCSLIDMTRTEVVGDPLDLRETNGTGGVSARRFRPASVTGYEYEMTLSSRIDPEMLDLLGYVDAVYLAGETVGFKAKDVLAASCDCDLTDVALAGVSMLVWSLAWLGEESHPDFDYNVEAVPRILFNPGIARSKSSEFTTLTITGQAAKNSAWAQGPGDIYPEVAGLDRHWAEFLTDTGWPGGCNCAVHGFRKEADDVGVPVPVETAAS
jgi:hypothetical protein